MDITTYFTPDIYSSDQAKALGDDQNVPHYLFNYPVNLGNYLPFLYPFLDMAQS